MRFPPCDAIKPPVRSSHSIGEPAPGRRVRDNRRSTKGHRKPSFNAAAVINTMLGQLAYESSLDLGRHNPGLEDAYCLRFREPNPSATDTITTTAIWSADRKFDNEYARQKGVGIQVPVANDQLFDLAYRDSSWVEGIDTLFVCDSTGRIPDELGAIVQTSVSPVKDPVTERWSVPVQVTGAPLYLQSSENRVVAPDDWADASTTMIGQATTAPMSTSTPNSPPPPTTTTACSPPAP